MRNLPFSFSDKTTDMSVYAQTVIIFRTVDKNLNVKENMMGLYKTNLTNSLALYKKIKD